jgi:hypothetical protein
MSSELDIIYMTYQRNDDTESETGRRTEIAITPEMIQAGAAELIFDSALDRLAVTEDVIRSALEAGGYKVG